MSIKQERAFAILEIVWVWFILQSKLNCLGVRIGLVLLLTSTVLNSFALKPLLREKGILTTTEYQHSAYMIKSIIIVLSLIALFFV